MVMKNKLFRVIDHTADIGIIAYGINIEQLFSNAAYALFSLIVEPESITERMHRYIRVAAENNENLLVAWLNELIYFFDTEHVLFNRFEINDLNSNQLTAICYGETIDPLKHRLIRYVKAATYHMLEIDSCSSGYKAQVIFDI
jgi:SHS2 domain-containing protein